MASSSHTGPQRTSSASAKTQQASTAAAAAAPADAISPAADGAPVFTTAPMENDVLLGRGRGLIMHAGNAAFQEIVRLRKHKYSHASSRSKKNKIARQLMQELSKCKGWTW